MFHTTARAALAALALGTALTGGALADQITGTATYLQRIALPQGAQLTVSLLDVSKQDVAAEVLATQRYDIPGVPVEFALDYDPDQIDDAMSYSIAAEIRAQDGLLFRTTQAYPVLTRGAGDRVELVLDIMPAQTSGGLNGDWQLRVLGDRALDDGQAVTLSFGDGDTVGVFAGCNRFTGKADIGDTSLSFDDTFAGTLMACPDALADLERDVMLGLARVASFGQEQDGLILFDADGAPVMILVRG
ncbi:MAG: YbaY family lipoprotein [Marinibacterium sp.]|nr:YbaY family lipoprotein [Marinibacterium sp.]